MPIDDLISDSRQRVEKSLDHWLPATTIQPSRLHEAMRYSVLSNGKYIRPVLVYAASQALGAEPSAADGPACAVELIHAYSLIHDDLPAMDDDDLRRGRPTCHKAYDDATAILAGDALQALAFHVLTHDAAMQATAGRRIEMIDTLAVASGSRGMAGGQALDLAAVGKKLTIAELENMHIHKTGALMRASVKLGALTCPDVDKDVLDKLDHYAKCVGLAFQVRDDILDIEGDTETLGKTQGADIARNKPTYPSILGLDGAQEVAAELHEKATESLQDLGESANPLRWIADFIVNRER